MRMPTHTNLYHRRIFTNDNRFLNGIASFVRWMLTPLMPVCLFVCRLLLDLITKQNNRIRCVPKTLQNFSVKVFSELNIYVVSSVVKSVWKFMHLRAQDAYILTLSVRESGSQSYDRKIVDNKTKWNEKKKKHMPNEHEWKVAKSKYFPLNFPL